MILKYLGCPKLEKSLLQKLKTAGTRKNNLDDIIYSLMNRSGKFGSSGRIKPRSTSLLGNSMISAGDQGGLSNLEWELLMTNATKLQYH